MPEQIVKNQQRIVMKQIMAVEMMKEMKEKIK